MQEQVKSKVSGLAIAGLICAILATLLFGIIVAVIGLVLGLIAFKQINHSKGAIKGRGIAMAAIIIAIAGTVLRLAIAIPQFIKMNERAKVAASLSNIAAIRTTLEMYKLDNGSYPKELSILVIDSKGKGVYLKELPKDAWGRDYIYRVKPDESFEIFSPGPDGIEGNKDDVRLSNF
ncbi:MAG: type II secretion system protein GspG [Candidatus Omnitrophota bacterium]